MNVLPVADPPLDDILDQINRIGAVLKWQPERIITDWIVIGNHLQMLVDIAHWQLRGETLSANAHTNYLLIVELYRDR